MSEAPQQLPAGASPAPPPGSGEATHRPVTTITAILLSVFLMSAGTGLQGSIISLRAGLEGFSEVMIGLIMSANYAGLVLGPLIAPPLIRNVGYVRTFAAFASIGSAAAISHVL